MASALRSIGRGVGNFLGVSSQGIPRGVRRRQKLAAQDAANDRAEAQALADLEAGPVAAGQTGRRLLLSSRRRRARRLGSTGGAS